MTRPDKEYLFRSVSHTPWFANHYTLWIIRPPDLSTTSETPSDSYHKRAISTPSSSPADNAFIDAPQASGFKSESSSDTGTGTTPRKQLSFPGDFVNETLRRDNLLDDTEEPMARKEQDGMRARISEPKSQASNCENAEADSAGRSELKCSCRPAFMQAMISDSLLFLLGLELESLQGIAEDLRAESAGSNGSDEACKALVGIWGLIEHARNKLRKLGDDRNRHFPRALAVPALSNNSDANVTCEVYNDSLDG
ncbi:hypothetical protein M422DRAFT_783209 [Sphaerobolus stellatus SS14]|uniref:Uncharacterized protein n=1 Tax=Sphaerobolus stellatus (strain SS14) TaxID=990650 RepID=A0A0C9V6V1_SPHS4|nr:hypothetical protein M422DRAFT_783209 [Sphaerobolus stellatus SS14]